MRMFLYSPSSSGRLGTEVYLKAKIPSNRKRVIVIIFFLITILFAFSWNVTERQYELCKNYEMSKLRPVHEHLDERKNSSYNLSTGFAKSSKVLILSYSDLKAGELTQHSNRTLYRMVRCNHMFYAAKHGYDYISPDPATPKWTATRFVLSGLRYKTYAILSYFDDYDVIVWIDHDALFYDTDVLVEDWIDRMHGGADLLMAEDIPGYRFNAGLQIIKTSNWTKNFYTTAVDELLKTKLDAGYIEQPIFYRLHDSLPNAKEKIQIHTPRSEFQAFLKLKEDFQESSWVVHGTQCKCDLGAYIRQQHCFQP